VPVRGAGPVSDRTLLRHARAGLPALVLTAGSGVLSGVLTLLQAWYLSRAIARVFLDRQPLDVVSGDLVALLIATLLRAGVVLAGEVAAGHLAARVKANLRGALFDHLLALGPIHARGERTGELTAVAVEGVEALDAYFSQYLPQVASAVVVPLLLVLVVFGADPVSAAVLAISAPLIPLFMVLIGKAADTLTRQQYDLLGRLSGHFLEVLQGLATIKIFGRSQDQIALIRLSSERFRSATMSVLRVAFISSLALEMLATIGTALVAVGVGLRLLHGRLEFQTALFVLLLAPEVYQPLRLLGGRFHARAAAMAASTRIFDILDTPVRGSARGGAMAPEDALPTVGAGPPGITFRDVHYTYDGSSDALRGASFEIPAGSTVALVGPSGAGKTTVVDLLLRFIEPVQGEVLINGVPLHRLPASAWRERIAWVPQNPYLFHDSVAANLRMARPEATMEELMRAARWAHVHDVICSLPQGYDTVLGERGARLSAGQAQRIALARAFLKEAPVLILDEPTSSVDPELESLLLDTIERLRRARTILIVAHRLATVSVADRVVVLAGGRVVESGDHATLRAHDGAYRRLLAAYQGTG
jgi:ATP-binding cassette subfamily C protein CydD